jgi:parallel beta-helix repeat protein
LCIIFTFTENLKNHDIGVFIEEIDDGDDILRKIGSIIAVTLVIISILGIYSFNSEITSGEVSIQGGYITADTTWYFSQSPYYIEGDIYVDENYSLTIEPGVNVRFNGDYSIYIDGNLNAVGLSDKMINFTTNITSPSFVKWDRIQINSTGQAEISYCNITWANYGILLSYSSYNNITNNNISSYGLYGIYLDHSMNNYIIQNEIFDGFQSGIYFKYSENNEIINNDIYWSAVQSGIELSFSSYNSLMSNNIHTNGHYGVNFQTSSNNTIIDNNIFSNVNENIMLYSTSNDNLILNNNIYDSPVGVDLDGSAYNIVTGNYVHSINQIGIFTSGSSYNYITNNNISNNDIGLWIFTNCHENRIYHNNIQDNPTQAMDDEADNYWNDTYPSGGNFWSGYMGVDLKSGPNQDEPGSDGFGDTHYNIDIDSADKYPLMQPFIGNSIHLQEGWNLISIPLIQSNTSLKSVLRSIDGDYDAVQIYNSTNNNDFWKHHHVSKAAHVNDLNGITNKIGFWIDITTPGGTLFTYRGTPLTQNQSIILYQGWNLVSFPSLEDRNRTQGLNNINFPGDVDSIWTHNVRSQKWEEIGESDYFETGRGYWIHSKVQKTWDVPL